MKKSKKIIFIFLSAFVCVFTLCFSFLGFNNSITVRADSVSENYSFDGSNTLTLPVYYTNGNAIQEFINFNFRVSFSSLGEVTTVVPDFSYYVLSSGVYGASLYNLICSDTFGGTAISSFSFNNNSMVIYSARNIETLQTGAFKIGVKCDLGFNSDVYKISMFMPSSFQIMTDHNIAYSHPLNIVYTDKNENNLLFELAVPTNYPFNSRIYYTSEDFSDNQIYNQGYQQGLLDNQTNVYNNGYNAGSSAGYGEGYNAGLKDSNQYSFFSLFGAVLDAPISALKGLLNFQIFGVNLLTLFTGLLTLAIILFVLRFIRGGK